MYEEAPAIVGCRTPAAPAHTETLSEGETTVMSGDAQRDIKATQRLARTAGLLYLLVFVLGMFAPIVLERFVIPGDAAGTADNIVRSLGLFRSSLVSWVVIVAADVALAVLFYVLLEPAGRVLSLVTAAFRLVYSAILGAFVLHLFDAFLLLTHPNRAAYLVTVERQAVAVSGLETFSAGFLLALLFFGVHLVLLGILLYRSRYVPKALGVLLTAAGVGYLIHGLASFFAANYGANAATFLLTPAVLGELGLTLWLLVKGVSVDAPEPEVAAAA